MKRIFAVILIIVLVYFSSNWKNSNLKAEEYGRPEGGRPIEAFELYQTSLNSPTPTPTPTPNPNDVYSCSRGIVNCSSTQCRDSLGGCKSSCQTTKSNQVCCARTARGRAKCICLSRGLGCGCRSRFDESYCSNE